MLYECLNDINMEDLRISFIPTWRRGMVTPAACQREVTSTFVSKIKQPKKITIGKKDTMVIVDEFEMFDSWVAEYFMEEDRLKAVEEGKC